MMDYIRNLSRPIMIVLVMIIVIGAGGCKSKKKAMEAANAAERTRIEQEASLQRERQQDEERKKREADEQARKDAESGEAKEAAPYARLDQYFDAIAGSGNLASANKNIDEALALFASDQTPVLIVISEEGGQKDYDRPTTIRAYLNYLKDQKKNVNKIGKLHFDSTDKIVEVELIKQK